MDKKSVLKKVRNRLEKEVLIRGEIDNPYIEKYIDIAIEELINEILGEIEKNRIEEYNKLKQSMRIHGI